MADVDMKPTPKAELDGALAELAAKKAEWVELPIPERIALLDRSIDCTVAAAEGQVRAACEAKSIPFDDALSAEEWLSGPMVLVRNLRLLKETLAQLHATGHPHLPEGAVQTRPDGQLVVQVFPQSRLERLIYPGVTAEIWMDPSLERGDLVESIAVAYSPAQTDSASPDPTSDGDDDAETEAEEAPGKGEIALVLGAGNVASIPPMDVLYKLLVENEVCVLKMNPVNAYLGPYIEQSLQPFVDAGYLRVVYGAAEEGAHLVQHEQVDSVHMTGSDFVHDIIVWGAPGEEQETNKAQGTPKLTKPITSELGCITPVIIVPGKWSSKALDFHAQNIATMVATNASFMCVAAKLLVTHRDWPQREALLQRVEEALAEVPLRTAYYPGSQRKFETMLEAHPEAKLLGERSDSVVPWTTIFDVDPTDTDDIVFKTEAWCGLLAETALPADDAGDFLDRAVAFCNEHVWGTLSCTLLIDEKTEKALGDRVEQAIADLRYGTVAKNIWSGLGYGLVITTWGAFPGHPLDDIGSGIGVVHNTLMFDRPQKSVIRAPFVMFPKPPWFVSHRRAHKLGRKLVEFEAKPSGWRVPGLAIRAMLG